MEKLEKASRKWWFFVILLAAQSVLLPIVSRNFDPQNIPRMVSVTLGNAVLCESVTPETAPELFKMLDDMIAKLRK